MTSKPILDVCCGSKMMWFDKNNPNVLFNDIHPRIDTLCDGRSLVVNPDTTFDCRQLRINDNSFYLVVLDPPHLRKAGKDSGLSKKYGTLPEQWQEFLKDAFNECLRVLKPYGTLVFKWNEQQVKLSEVLTLLPVKPLFGHRRGKTHFIVFMKGLDDDTIQM